MAFIDFIKIKSNTAPAVEDFYTFIDGYFDGITVIPYVPQSEDYEIIQSDIEEWTLRIDDKITAKFSNIFLNTNCLYINPAAVSLPLNAIFFTDTLLSDSTYEEIFLYWSQIPAIEPDNYIVNVTVDIVGDNIFSDAFEAAALILQSRGWLITKFNRTPILETPTPTPTIPFAVSRTPRPTPTVTKTPHPTPTTTPTDVLEKSVITLGGSGRAGDVDGSICIQSLELITPTPSNTPTPTPTPTITSIARDERLYVETIAGIGKKGDRGGKTCNFVPGLTVTPTQTLTNTPTPSITHELYLGVKTIGGSGTPGDADGSICNIFNVPVVSPTPTKTDTYSGSRVKTIAGNKGRTGDLDGISCNFTLPTPTTTKTPRPTPTVTPTITRTPTITPTASITPTITPTASITPTITPTASITPSFTSTNTCTPTPSVTPSITPSCTVRCLVVTPKIEEPCCAEPALAKDHGSTTFNSRVTTYAKLLNRIKSSLGFPLIQLEVTDEQIYNAIDISIEFFTKFSGYTEEYLIFRSDLYKRGYGLPIGDLFSITPELSDNINYTCPKISANSMGYDFDLNARRIVMSVFSVAPGDNSGINTLFTIEQTIAQQAYFGHLLGNIGFDLITFDVLKIWLKTREKVLALKPYFRFYPEQQLLRLTPEPENRGTPYFGIIGAYVQKPIRELISQLWIYKYTMAQIKITMAHTRGKYSGTGLFGGQTVNYTDLMTQGTKELDELEKELKTDLIDREPIPFFLG